VGNGYQASVFADGVRRWEGDGVAYGDSRHNNRILSIGRQTSRHPLDLDNDVVAATSQATKRGIGLKGRTIIDTILK
jgi:hypothetical protein